MQKKESDIPLWLVVASLVVFPPAGVILLILRLMGVHMSGITKGTAGQSRSSTTTYNGTGNTATPKSQPTPSTFLENAVEKNRKSGRRIAIFGGLLAAIGFLAFVGEVGDYGFSYVEDWLPYLAMTAGGMFTMGIGFLKTRLANRQRLYLGAIGKKKSVFLSDLAQATGFSQRKVEKDIQKMLSDGTLPQGYIDRASGRLVLTKEGYTPPEPEQTAKVVGEATQEDKDRAILLQIRAINDAIPGDEMSRKIDRIEEITGKILAYAREHPAKSSELRSFLNYYLPTTLKILNAYAQMDSQGISGENIDAAKRRIEDMMDKVVDGFEKQLDQLFRSDAMDITADVEVLERMLKKDGLSGSDEITLTLHPSGTAAAYQKKPR